MKFEFCDNFREFVIMITTIHFTRYQKNGIFYSQRTIRTEQRIQRAFEKLMTGRTSFIIAHRLSTITKCDKIMYIDNGGITECGSHDELMARKGAYYHLFTAQMEGMEAV